MSPNCFLIAFSTRAALSLPRALTFASESMTAPPIVHGAAFAASVCQFDGAASSPATLLVSSAASVSVNVDIAAFPDDVDVGVAEGAPFFSDADFELQETATNAERRSHRMSRLYSIVVVALLHDRGGLEHFANLGQ